MNIGEIAPEGTGWIWIVVDNPLRNVATTKTLINTQEIGNGLQNAIPRTVKIRSLDS